MKVRDLIKLLKEYEEDREVVIVEEFRNELEIETLEPVINLRRKNPRWRVGIKVKEES